MPSDYLPNDAESLCEWLENFKIEFAAVASSLGFTTPEVTAVLNDCSWALYDCRASADAGTFARAWINFRDAHLHGDPNAPVGPLPNTATPTPPVGLPPALGIVTRLRGTVKRLKGAPAYTPAIGEALRVVGSNPPVDPTTAKPPLRARPLTMFQAELRWKRGSFSGVLVQSQRDGEESWTDLGVKTGTTFVDERAPQQPNRPEVRRYRQVYVKNDEPVGLWSDVVSVTVSP
jgi:hypothetical protein